MLSEGLVWLLHLDANRGLKAENKIVQEHYYFNYVAVRALEGIILSFQLTRLFEDDFGIRIRDSPCLNWIVAVFFLLMRLVIAIVTLLIVLPSCLYVIWKSIALCWENTIVNGEYWIANEIGYFNLLLCYAISICLIFFIWIFWIVYTCINGFCQALCPNSYREPSCFERLASTFSEWYRFVLGRNFGSNRYEGRRAYDEEDEDSFHDSDSSLGDAPALQRRTTDLLNPRTRKNPFTAARECPICLEEFGEDTMVVQLDCSPMHIYHPDCLRQMVELDSKCAICRQEIKY